MHDKLDPRLLETVERANAGAADANELIDVLVALDGRLTADIKRELMANGLSLRSELGTVLTGNVAVQDVPRLAASSHITKLEASSPLYAEFGDGSAEGELPSG